MVNKEDLKERLEKFDADFDDSKAKNANKKYWVGGVGEEGRDPDDFYSNNIFAIGWDALNDLKRYKNKGSIEKALKKSIRKNKKEDLPIMLSLAIRSLTTLVKVTSFS